MPDHRVEIRCLFPLHYAIHPMTFSCENYLNALIKNRDKLNDGALTDEKREAEAISNIWFRHDVSPLAMKDASQSDET